MTITLNEYIYPASSQKEGSETITLVAGNKLQVRTFAPGVTELLDVEVPAGQTWRVTIQVRAIVS